MPRTDVYFFQDADKSVPLLEWLQAQPLNVKAKCVERIERLGELGRELRRPTADFLRDGIYELRASYQGIHYRMLYFFAGKVVVVVSHGFTKERQVPWKEIELAVRRKRLVEANFERFTFEPE